MLHFKVFNNNEIISPKSDKINISILHENNLQTPTIRAFYQYVQHPYELHAHEIFWVLYP